MTRKVAVVLLVCSLTSLIVSARDRDVTGELPALHQIYTATLTPSYGCRPPAEFSRGYQGTALFLSTYSRTRNAPDLLFNGACGSDDYFQASTAGDDMALIADLGTEVPLADVSAHKAFNVRNIAGTDNESKFAQSAPVALGHTYVVLLNKSDVRGLFAIRVTAHERNRSVTLQYAVKQYQLLDVTAQSPGFDWGTQNLSANNP
jgi:hypothetical protein